jgi:hypothetical protein
VFALDETGTALAGKIAASLFSALAAGLLYLAVGRRRPPVDATWAAVALALGTTVWSTSQALWQHPAAVLFLCWALLWIVRAQDDDAWAGRAGLPLALAFAARHADVALVAALGLGVAARWPRRIPALVLWAAAPLALVGLYGWLSFGAPWAHGFSDSRGRFGAGGLSHLGLLVSPAKGLLVFTPAALVCLVGLLRAWRSGERWLVGTLSGAALAHFLLMGAWTEWHGGQSWGPRMLTDAMPLLFFFLPEGLALRPGLGRALVIVSITVQALGAFAYDYRWERLYQRADADGSEIWDVARSPIPFHVGERVVILAAPAVRDGKAVVRQHPVVVAGPEGSRVTFEADRPVLRGSELLLGDVHAQRGARLFAAKLWLKGRWDGLFARVREPARQRRLELRVVGRGRGTLYVGERSFWTDWKWSAYPMGGSFRIRHPYYFPESGGPDVLVTLGRAAGEAELDSVSLVPPNEPENRIQLP